jgi:dystrophin
LVFLRSCSDISSSCAFSHKFIEQDDINSLEILFVDFQTSLIKVKEWLTKAEGTLVAHEQLPVYQQMSDYEREKIHRLQAEISDLVGQVEEVRDSALSLMNKSDHYSAMVEPELTHLNQRWEDIRQRVKVSVHV